MKEGKSDSFQLKMGSYIDIQDESSSNVMLNSNLNS